MLGGCGLTSTKSSILEVRCQLRNSLARAKCKAAKYNFTSARMSYVALELKPLKTKEDRTPKPKAKYLKQRTRNHGAYFGRPHTPNKEAKCCNFECLPPCSHSAKPSGSEYCEESRRCPPTSKTLPHRPRKNDCDCAVVMLLNITACSPRTNLPQGFTGKIQTPVQIDDRAAEPHRRRRKQCLHVASCSFLDPQTDHGSTGVAPLRHSAHEITGLNAHREVNRSSDSNGRSWGAGPPLLTILGCMLHLHAHFHRTLHSHDRGQNNGPQTLHYQCTLHTAAHMHIQSIALLH